MHCLLSMLALCYTSVQCTVFLSVLQFGQSSIVSPVQGLERGFLDAAYTGDLPRVKDLLEQGCPVNAKDEVSTTVQRVF